MRSILELELHAAWKRESLIAEAEANRLANLARRQPESLRSRVAAALYALADWLSPELRQHPGLEASGRLLLLPGTLAFGPQNGHQKS